MNWFTADTHFFHKNVIEYCNRPFRDLEEMHEKIIERWNLMVKAEDTVYLLGDVCFAGRNKLKPILAQLRGEIVLVKGNHDHTDHTRLFNRVVPSMEMQIADLRVSLSHYPYPPPLGEKYDDRYPERRLEDKGGWLLHGHVHCSWKVHRRMINVGVDVWGFAPVSENEILTIIKSGGHYSPLPT